MLAFGTVVGLVVLAVLIVVFIRKRSQDMLAALIEKRRATSRVVSRAEYVEGMNHLPVALALSDDTLYYENEDLQAMFELSRIDEVEYDDELATGGRVSAGCSVMRLRSHGTVFEFVMPTAEIAKWQQALPARQAGAAPAKAAV